jgi:predicted lipoprotein
MNKHLASIAKRFVAAVLVIAAVVGVSALTIHEPTQNQNSVARSLKSIQTDKATLFYAKAVPNMGWFVEQVLASTGESKAATENLKSIVAAL